MSEFEYLLKCDTPASIGERYSMEQAYQLKRIADALEQQQPFEWKDMFWTRSEVTWVSPVTQFENKSEGRLLRIKLRGEGQHKFTFPTKEKAEAARAEFIRLLKGE